MIRMLEVSNDNLNVFIFYDEEERCYKAYGHSAYYEDKVTIGRLYYSVELCMPMMVFASME